MLPPELNGRRDETVLNDPRVIHFWDRGRTVNQFFATSVSLEGPERSSLNNLYGGAIWGQFIWDVYLLYGPDAVWNDVPDHLLSSGYPILSTRVALRDLPSDPIFLSRLRKSWCRPRMKSSRPNRLSLMAWGKRLRGVTLYQLCSRRH